jgi:hypothetical protein
MDNILKEQGFQKSGACNEEQCLVEMGRLLGVQFMVSGSIGSVGKLLVLNFRVIDVESGKITRALSRDVQGGAEQIIKLLPAVADEIVGAETGGRGEASATAANNGEAVQTPKSQTSAESVGSPPTGHLSGRPTGKTQLAINVYPENAAVYVNDSLVNRGNIILNVEPGTYNVYARLTSNTTPIQTVTVYKDERTDVRLRLEHPIRFAFSPSYMFNPGGLSYEPSFGIQAGLLIKKHYAGIAFHIPISIRSNSVYAPTYTQHTTTSNFGGIGLIYGYQFLIGKIFCVTPGLTAGFWAEDRVEHDQFYDVWGENEEFYFGGPTLHLELGYKHVFFSTNATVLFAAGAPKYLVAPGVTVLF